MFFNWRMDKENVVNFYNGVWFNYLENDIMKIAGKWMQLEKKIILSEVTQNLKYEYLMYSLTIRH